MSHRMAHTTRGCKSKQHTHNLSHTLSHLHCRPNFLCREALGHILDHVYLHHLKKQYFLLWAMILPLLVLDQNNSKSMRPSIGTPHSIFIARTHAHTLSHSLYCSRYLICALFLETRIVCTIRNGLPQSQTMHNMPPQWHHISALLTFQLLMRAQPHTHHHQLPHPHQQHHHHHQHPKISEEGWSGGSRQFLQQPHLQQQQQLQHRQQPVVCINYCWILNRCCQLWWYRGDSEMCSRRYLLLVTEGGSFKLDAKAMAALEKYKVQKK